MKPFLQKVLNVLGGRIARNIYFWAFMIYSRLDFDNSRWQTIFTGILFLLLMILAYVNNLLLVPRLMARKKYLLYWIVYSAMTFILSLGYIYTLKIMVHYFPSYTVGRVSTISNTASGNLSLSSALSEQTTYFWVMFTLGCIFTMCWYVMDYARQQKLIETTTKKQVEIELTFLKNQINPHFLFNTLNNLYALSIKKSENTPNVILKLSSILRYLLYESNVDKVSFEKEKEVMQAYIDLELLRLQQSDGMTFKISADRAYNIPPLLWLPILENLFKHGTRFIADKYFLEYRFSIENNLLMIYSKNIYKAKAENEQADNAGGVGLENLKKRLALLYPGKHKFVTSKEDNYYITEVEIQIV